LRKTISLSNVRHTYLLQLFVQAVDTLKRGGELVVLLGKFRAQNGILGSSVLARMCVSLGLRGVSNAGPTLYALAICLAFARRSSASASLAVSSSDLYASSCMHTLAPY
jgi:hypothetical protein